MVSTTNYALEKYEAGNSANLLDQYNASMDKIDTAIKSVSDKADLALNNNVLPAGLAAFITALGLTETNAKTLGTTLNHILNHTGTETFTVTDLAGLKKTAEGYPIPPAK
jgi:tetrahydromethanopterin S-methyltransferase subunit F